MDGYSGKRAGRGSGIAFRDASQHDDRSVHCNRLVCSNKLNFMKGPQVGNSDRDKSSRSFHISGKAVAGSSSKAYYKKASLESQDPSSHKGSLSVESNTMQLEKFSTEPSSSTGRTQMKLSTTKDAEFGDINTPSNTLEEVDSCSLTSNTRIHKQIRRQSGQTYHETSQGPSTRQYSGPRNIGQSAKSASHGHGFNASRPSSSSSSSSSNLHTNRYGLRNLGCTSISDVLPPGCSSPASNHNRMTDMVKRRNLDGDYCSAKGKSATASSSAGNSVSRKNSLAAGRSLSLSERASQPTSRRTRYWLPTRNGVTSVRTRRTMNEDNRSRVSEHDNSTSRFDSPVMIPQLLHNDVSVSESSSSSSQQSEPELPAIGQSSFAQLGRNENVRSSQTAHLQDVSARPFSSLSIDRDGHRRFNRDGIAEVLLALERIEQDEELSYEQLLILETNLFLSGLGFHDQHRDMRLDIDNMSYEELLALGDKMGTVSTGLSEEQLLNCLKKSFYMSAPSSPRICCEGDNFKCSICQEEYAEGDELGRLQCDHHYHVVCIHQWLQLKNWCPICKANATES